MFENLEAVTSALIEATQAEAASKFLQGDILLAATEPDTLEHLGMTRKEFLSWAGNSTGRGRRTIFKRLKVAQVFPPDARCEALSWEHHHTCACSDDPATWLATAADQGLSLEQLEMAIKGKVGPEPVYLCKAAEAIVWYAEGAHLVLKLAHPVEVAAHTPVLVTVMLAPAEEKRDQAVA